MCRRPGVVGCAVLFSSVRLGISVYVIMKARARLQAGGASFRSWKLRCAMQAFVRCWFAYFVIANMRASLHAGGASIFPRTETAICIAYICVMTDANKQTQCFGPTLSAVLAQSESAGERWL